MSKVVDNLDIKWKDIMIRELKKWPHDWDLITECLENCNECIHYFVTEHKNSIFTRNISNDIIERIVNASLPYFHENMNYSDFSKSVSILFNQFKYIDDACNYCMEYIINNNLTLKVSSMIYSFKNNLKLFEKYISYDILDFSDFDVEDFIINIRAGDYLIYIFDKYSDVLKLHEYEFNPHNTHLMEEWAVICDRGYNVDLSSYGYKATYQLNLLQENRKLKEELTDVKERLCDLEKKLIDLLNHK